MNKAYSIMSGWVIAGILTGSFSAALAATEPKAINALVDEIVAGYQRIDDLQASFSQKSVMPDGEVLVSVTLTYLKPNYMKADAQVQQGDSPSMRIMTVFDGAILWQENYGPDATVTNVIKSAVDVSDPAGEAMVKQFAPAAVFNGLLEQYNATDLSGAAEKEKVLAMSLKPNYRLQMQQSAEMAGTPQAESFIPEYVNFYWDAEQGFCRKIETLNAKKDIVATLAYSDVRINSGLTAAEFVYTPPPDVPVLDMAELMQQQGSPEGVDLTGKPFPDFELPTVEGKTVALSSLKNKIMIINFWADWCPPCKKELPLVQKLHEALAGDKDVALLTVTAAEAEAAQAFLDEQGYNFPVLLDVDNTLAEACSVMSIPRTFIVGKDGMIAEVLIGYKLDFEQHILEQINQLKAQ